MTKEDILEYVSHTPHNTNPNMIGNMIDALTAQSGGGLPDPSEASAGDILSLDENKKPKWAAPSDDLPDIQNGDAGKVLKVNAGETGTEWGEISAGVPTIGDSDARKILAVNATSDGSEWKKLNILPFVNFATDANGTVTKCGIPPSIFGGSEPNTAFDDARIYFITAESYAGRGVFLNYGGNYTTYFRGIIISATSSSTAVTIKGIGIWAGNPDYYGTVELTWTKATNKITYTSKTFTVT